MKYTININQLAITKLNEQKGLSLDVTDASIIYLFISMIKAGKAKKEGDYYKFNYKIIGEQLPILFLTTKSPIRYRYKKLIDAGILEPRQESNGGQSLQYFKVNFINELQFCDKNTSFLSEQIEARANSSTGKFEHESEQIEAQKVSKYKHAYKDNKYNNKENNNNKIDFFGEIMKYLNANPEIAKKLNLDFPIELAVEMFINFNLKINKIAMRMDPAKHAKGHFVNFVVNCKSFPDYFYPEVHEDKSKHDESYFKKWEKTNRHLNKSPLYKYRAIKPLTISDVERISRGGTLHDAARKKRDAQWIDETIRSVFDKVIKGEIINGKLINHIEKELLS